MDAPETIQAPKSLQEAVLFYSNIDNCIDILVSLRWANGVVCPHCACYDVTYMKSRRVWQCKTKECRKQFSIKVGTIFEDSPLGLDKWLIALWLICNCKNGVSSYEVSRALAITQKSAWFMLHRLRLAMQNGSLAKLEHEVEADETFIGGKAKNMHKDKREKAIQGRGSVGKAVVMGILNRGEEYTDKHGETKKTTSQVKASVIPDTKRETLHAEIKAAVEPGTPLYTDAALGYRGLSKEFGHKFIDHAVTYAEGKVSTNGLENFWSLTKRALKGTYVSVEPEHLIAYIDEQAFRFNERDKKDGGRFVKALSQVAGKRLTYKTLIGDPQGIDSPDPLRGGPRAD